MIDELQEHIKAKFYMNCLDKKQENLAEIDEKVDSDISEEVESVKAQNDEDFKNNDMLEEIGCHVIQG